MYTLTVFPYCSVPEYYEYGLGTKEEKYNNYGKANIFKHIFQTHLNDLHTLKKKIKHICK